MANFDIKVNTNGLGTYEIFYDETGLLAEVHFFPNIGITIEGYFKVKEYIKGEFWKETEERFVIGHPRQIHKDYDCVLYFDLSGNESISYEVTIFGNSGFIPYKIFPGDGADIKFFFRAHYDRESDLYLFKIALHDGFIPLKAVFFHSLTEQIPNDKAPFGLSGDPEHDTDFGIVADSYNVFKKCVFWVLKPTHCLLYDPESKKLISSGNRLVTEC